MCPRFLLHGQIDLLDLLVSVNEFTQLPLMNHSGMAPRWQRWVNEPQGKNPDGRKLICSLPKEKQTKDKAFCCETK